MAAGIGLGISMGWAYIKEALGPTVNGIFSILQGRSTYFVNETDSKEYAQNFEDAGILSKASILYTPTGYGATSLNAVLPSSAPFADLEKTGGTNTTIINENGNVENIAGDIPRIDFENGTGEILSEQSRTNFLKATENSDAYASSYWTINGSGIYAGITRVLVNPRGVSQTFRSYYFSGSASVRNLIAGTTGATTYGLAASAWVYVTRNDPSTTSTVNIGIIGHAGSPQSHTVPVGTWTRISFIRAHGIDPTGIYFSAPGATLNIWGTQLERSFQTFQVGRVSSYIPSTGTGSTSRSRENYTKNGIASLVNSVQGVLYLHASFKNLGNNQFFQLEGTGFRKVQIYGNTNGSVTCAVVTSTGKYFGAGASADSMNKIAVRWNGTTAAVYTNGAKIGNDITMDSAFSEGDLYEIGWDNSTQPFVGRMRELAVFNEALTDAEMIALTTP
jgi:hypothetical protein